MTDDLAHYLRQIPVTASIDLKSTDLTPEEAADDAFDDTCEALLGEFSTAAPKLLSNLEFRLALAAITSSAHLIVEVDPAAGPTRVLTYSYVRPITPRRRSHQHQGFLRRRARLLSRYVLRSGTAKLVVDLGAMGGCDRYRLTAEAPFDTWFADAEIARTDGRPNDDSTVDCETIDTSQGFRLSYTKMSSPTPWLGALRVELRTVYTGVARASVYATAFLAACAIAGLLRVVFSDDHTLINGNTDAAASLLLLFPGIAASAVAGVAPNKLTATLQFPMRFTLWTMSLASFSLAVATGFGLKGVPNLALWAVVTAFTCAVAVILRFRSRAWDHARHAATRRGSS
jgi:hypothetical protein